MFLQKADLTSDNSFICRVVAKDEKLRSLIEKGELILRSDPYK
jgi:hypothetical protein